MAPMRRENVPAQGELPRRRRSVRRTRSAQGWAWLHHVIKAMREGRSQAAAVESANFAALGYRERVTIAWKGDVWKPIEFFMRNDGTIIRTDLAPSRPDIDPQFLHLFDTSWLATALSADANA
jgi:hypothetical protein